MRTKVSVPFAGANDTGVFTPPIGSLQTVGSSKLLNILFVVDGSSSMEGARIASVNTALSELYFDLTDLKRDRQLDVRVAVMSFSSSVKWELGLTPIDQAVFGEVRTRPGLTMYSAVFSELDKVLRRDRFMAYDGDVAAPVIIFMTDGKPNDNYEPALKELQENVWFRSALRSAILMGDAIGDEEARRAVRGFVKDGDRSIVAVQDSEQIISRIVTATVKTIRGIPQAAAEQDDAPSPAPDAFAYPAGTDAPEFPGGSVLSL
ncbi:MAG: VWA domain-containing protein [Oscillospiraceae bacterium]|nr:VWA domain-containing protein [Oscillospiraceae bacterium]